MFNQSQLVRWIVYSIVPFRGFGIELLILELFCSKLMPFVCGVQWILLGIKFISVRSWMYDCNELAEVLLMHWVEQKLNLIVKIVIGISFLPTGGAVIASANSVSPA